MDKALRDFGFDLADLLGIQIIGPKKVQEFINFLWLNFRSQLSCGSTNAEWLGG